MIEPSDYSVFERVIGYTPPIVILALIVYIWVKQDKKIDVLASECAKIGALDKSLSLILKSMDDLRIDIRDSVSLVHKTQKELYDSQNKIYSDILSRINK